MNVFQVIVTQNATGGKHIGVGARSLHVVMRENMIKRIRGGKFLYEGVSGLAKSSAPSLACMTV